MFHSIKGIFHIDFNYHFLISVRNTSMDGFLHQNDVIPYFPFCHKAPLIWENDPWEQVFYPVCYNFCENLVGDITERDGMESVKGVFILYFRDQSRKIGISGYS